ncbi:MAG TPA: amino acid ABC transporter substrate-binding protein [Burkholderiales bacterium]|nr:amino acid ABC transporter substrate-binding protein [Burkholderiales bacterium]
MIRSVALLILALFTAGALHAQALDGRLKKIAETKAISIAYRTDSVPFSFVDAGKEPQGFAIDLCKRVVGSIERQLKIQGLKINWVPVTVQSRFDTVAKGRADMECGSSTITLSRLKQVEFSNVTFVESTGLLAKKEAGLRSLSDLSDKKIAVIAGTTNQRAVEAQVKRRLLSAAVMPFNSREEAIAALEEGKVDAFASDRLLLIGAAVKAKNPEALILLGDQLSFEPYGIVLPRGDTALRHAVNAGLAQLYASPEIGEIFRRWFAQLGAPPAIVEAVYILGAIPE